MLIFGSKPRKVYRPQVSRSSADSSRKQWEETFFSFRTAWIGVQISESSSQQTGATLYCPPFCSSRISSRVGKIFTGTSVSLPGKKNPRQNASVRDE